MSNIPVILITFNRPKHTRHTISALKVNRPALMYIFQDGPRAGNEFDMNNCQKVLEEIRNSVDWPCDLHIHCSPQNMGCRNHIIFAITEVLKDYESAIVIEDDIITSPAFIPYMNKALEYYKDKKAVFSISGYSHSPERFTIPSDYPYDVYASPRLFNWGWGTWRDRWEKVDWSFSYYDEFMNHPYEQKAFMRGGEDLLPMLIDEYEGRSSAWDIQFAFAHFANHAVSIVPCVSYTHNIGLDGSGTHCNNEKKKKDIDIHDLNNNTDPKFIDNLYFDSRIINSVFSIFCKKKRPIWQKACNYIARKLRRSAPYKIKKRVYAEEQ